MAAEAGEAAAQRQLVPALGLADLPHTVVAVVLHHLVGSGAGGGASSGTARDMVALAFCSKAMLQAVAAAEQLWQQQCHRLGWRCALFLLPAALLHLAAANNHL